MEVGVSECVLGKACGSILGILGGNMDNILTGVEGYVGSILIAGGRACG